MMLARKSPNSWWCPGSCWTSTASAKAWGGSSRAGEPLLQCQGRCFISELAPRAIRALPLHGQDSPGRTCSQSSQQANGASKRCWKAESGLKILFLGSKSPRESICFYLRAVWSQSSARVGVKTGNQSKSRAQAEPLHTWFSQLSCRSVHSSSVAKGAREEAGHLSVGFESRTQSFAQFSFELRALGAADGRERSRHCLCCVSLARVLRGPWSYCGLDSQEGWRRDSCLCPASLAVLCSWAGARDPGQKQWMLHWKMDSG